MPIHRFLKKQVFGPEDIQLMTTAFEDALRVLQLHDRSDPVTEIIAKAIIDIAQAGERDPVQLRKRAIAKSGVPRVE